MRIQACPAEEQVNSFEMARVKSTDFPEHRQSIQTSQWQLQSISRQLATARKRVRKRQNVQANFSPPQPTWKAISS
jgi:hypothetical protein